MYSFSESQHKPNFLVSNKNPLSQVVQPGPWVLGLSFPSIHTCAAQAGHDLCLCHKDSIGPQNFDVWADLEPFPSYIKVK